MVALTIVIACWSRAALRQKEAVEAIRVAGGSVRYDFEYPIVDGQSPIPRSVLNVFGTDVFHSVVSVHVPSRIRRPEPSRTELLHQLTAFPHLECLHLAHYDPINDDDLQIIGAFRQLKVLTISDGSAITDDGMRHLRGLDQLEDLLLNSRVRIADGGSGTLAKLSALKELKLVYPELTKDALVRIGSMKQLKRLWLRGAKGINDDGLQALAKLTNLTNLDLNAATTISDEGLKSLPSLKNLVVLDLSDTGITDNGTKHLIGLTQLKELNLEGTAITKASLQTIQSALPSCKVLATVKTLNTGEPFDQ